MGRNITEFFSNGDDVTPQASNVINLVGTLNSSTSLTEGEVVAITERVLKDHSFKNWAFTVTDSSSSNPGDLQFAYSWPTTINE